MATVNKSYCTLPGPVCPEKYRELIEKHGDHIFETAGHNLSIFAREPLREPTLSLSSSSGWTVVDHYSRCFGATKPLPVVENSVLRRAGGAQAGINKPSHVAENSGSQEQDQSTVSPEIRVAADATFGLGTNFTWDSYQRQLYRAINAAYQKQANAMREAGNVGEAELRALIDQRNQLVLAARQPLSPFGKLYSEILKPASDLPTFEKLIQQKGSIEAVLESVGKTRKVTDRLAATFSIAGRGAVVLNIVLTAVLIIKAKPEDRARVSARQAGGMTGGAIGSWAGAWAGCAAFASAASPTLFIPGYGELSEGAACAAGAIIGGLGLGAVGAWGGEKAGEAAYDYVTQLTWISQ
jgi:hypothetical protein